MYMASVLYLWRRRVLDARIGTRSPQVIMSDSEAWAANQKSEDCREHRANHVTLILSLGVAFKFGNGAVTKFGTRVKSPLNQ